MAILLFIIATLLPIQDTKKTAQENPSAQEVIDKYIEAKGGKEKLEKTKNIVLKGVVSINGKEAGEFEIFQAVNKHLTIETTTDGRSRSNGTDGKAAWLIDFEGKPEILSGQAARDYIRHYSTLHQALEWPKRYARIEYVERTTIEKVLVHHLRFHANDGPKIERYFDATSGLFVQEEQTLEGENRSKVVSQIKNYVADTGGVMSSRLRVNIMGPEYWVEYKVLSVEINQIKDESIFAIPGAVLKLIEKSELKK